MAPRLPEQLPAPRVGPVRLDEALRLRRSVRELTGPALTADEVAQLVWAAQGISGPDGLRTAPSAGATYPLELYVVTAAGHYHYRPAPHRLVARGDRDLRPALHRAALYQEAVEEAPAVFVLCGVAARVAARYGAERASRYLWLEAGHAAENLLLEAASLGLAGVPVGAFHDAKLRAALGLPDGEEPLYLVPIGRPRRAGG